MSAHSDLGLTDGTIEEIAQVAVDSTLPSPSDAFKEMFVRLAGTLRRQDSLLLYANRHLAEHPDRVEQRMREHGTDRAEAQDVERAHFVSDSEKRRRGLADLALPTFIRPLVGFDDDFITFEGDITIRGVQDVLARAAQPAKGPSTEDSTVSDSGSAKVRESDRSSDGGPRVAGEGGDD